MKFLKFSLVFLEISKFSLVYMSSLGFFSVFFETSKFSLVFFPGNFHYVYSGLQNIMCIPVYKYTKIPGKNTNENFEISKNTQKT